MKKQNIAIIGVVAFILAVAIGYALFSETLTVSGTASASGDFDVEFTSVGTPTCEGFSGTCDANSLATIESGNNELTVTVNKLDYPGSYVEIPVTITNKGSVPAVLKQINQTGLDSDAGPIKVTYSGLAASETPINQNETHSMTIRVEWLESVNTTASEAEFTITLDYEQVES